MKDGTLIRMGIITSFTGAPWQEAPQTLRSLEMGMGCLRIPKNWEGRSISSRGREGMVEKFPI